jgi:mono/diheme cytochrome c family protein
MTSRWPFSFLIVAGLLWRDTFAFADDIFEKEIRSMLVQHCIECHGSQARSGFVWIQGGLKRAGAGPTIQPGMPDAHRSSKAIMAG